MLAWGAAGLLAAAGCATGRGAGDEEAPAAAEPAAEVPAEPEAPAEPEPPAEPPVRKALIVVDPGGGGARPSPGELASRSAARPPGAAAPRITNDNLAEYARGGHLTVAESSMADEAAAAAAAAAEEAEAGEGADPATAGEPAKPPEEYWRDRLGGLRRAWRETADEIERLEAEAADLRWRFYAADDAWERDGRIKPEWDRVRDRLEEARADLAAFPDRVAEALDEGRRAGALPGWLREGVELEPERPEGADDRDPAEPVEPPIFEPEPGPGGSP